MPANDHDTDHTTGNPPPPANARIMPLRILGAVLGGTLTFFCIVLALGIWIGYDDNDGGEPGAQTIFASIPLWPLFGLLILFGMLACATSRRLCLALLLLTGALLTWMWIANA